MDSLKKFLKEEISKIKQAGLYRQRYVLPDDIVDFSSNDYLSLKDNETTKEKLCEFIETLPLGSGASALISGYHPIQQELENFIADFKNTQACMVVGSGYMANLGLIQALATENDTIFSDSLNHASIIDGVRLSKAKKEIYKHTDMQDLEEKLKKCQKGKRIIVTDSVFSMDGNIAPLKDLTYLADKYDATLIIDEAHATGVLGKEGRGTLSHFGIDTKENVIQVGTLSKAVGSYGAFICAAKIVIDYLVNRMRSVIYTTALSPVQNFISLQNMKILKEDEGRRKRLYRNMFYFVDMARKSGLRINFHNTPIITIMTYDPEKTIHIREKLLEKRFFVGAIRPPTVPKGSSRLRITITSDHTHQEIESFLYAIREVSVG